MDVEGRPVTRTTHTHPLDTNPRQEHTMNDSTEDRSLNDTDATTEGAPQQAAPAGGVFGNPEGPTPTGVYVPHSIEAILAMAKTPEKRARICVRADLEARHEAILAELATLVTTSGELIEEPDASLGGDTAARRAQNLHADLQVVEEEMRAAMWFPLFRGLSSADFEVFHKKHHKGGDASEAPYFNQLVAATCVEPELTLEQIVQLRKKLGARAIKELTDTALEVCTKGGLSVPKSPASLLNLTRVSQES